MKSIDTYVITAAIFLLTMVANTNSKAQQRQPFGPKLISTVLPENQLNGANNAPGQSSVGKKARPVFDKRNFDKQIRSVQKIENGRAGLTAQRHNVQRQDSIQQLRKKLAVRPLEKATFCGKTTRFAQAPTIAHSRFSSGISKVLSSNLLINGQSQDTVAIGDPLTLTFSFGTNAASAILNIYRDSDGDGSLSPADPLLTSLLFLDNDDNDLNGASGAYVLRLDAGDVYTHLVGSFILELNDYQSVSTAEVVIRQNSTTRVILGMLSPPVSDVMFILQENSSQTNSFSYTYVFTDPAGNFLYFVVRSQTTSLRIYAVLDFGNGLNGFVPPGDSILTIASDTTRLALVCAQATSFIEGDVRDQLGSAVVNATVIGYHQSFMIKTQTDSSGHYKLGVNAGYWDVEVLGTPDCMPHARWYQFNVAPNATVHFNPEFIRANSTVSGKVYSGGNGFGGIPLSAFSDSLSNSVLSGANGEYSLPVYASPSHTMLYSVSASVTNGFYIPVPVRSNVQPGAIGVDFQVSKVAGGLQGRITDSGTGAPIPNAFMWISGSGSYRSIASNDSGYYRTSLVDGSYNLSVEANGYFDYYAQNIVIAGSYITKNILLDKAGTISGKVTDTDGNAILSALIYATDNLSVNYGYAYSDLDGKYIINGLHSSSYRVSCSASGYIWQYYDGASDIDNATLVSVNLGFDTPNINFVLSHGGSISGKVVDNSGRPIGGVEIDVLDTVYSYQSYALSDDSGSYRASGLRTAKYFVRTYSPEYFDQWYDGSSSSQGAKSVSVTMDQETSNINFALSKGGSISGTVRNKLNQAIPYAYIYAVDSTLYFAAHAYVDSAGEYVINRLRPGMRYYVYAAASGYANRWYNNVSTPDSATPIILQGEERRTGIDFNLPLSAVISGRVWDNTGSPISYAYVNLLDKQSNYVGYGYTDYQGSYQVNGLSGGTYLAVASGYGYEQQWYDHKSSFAQADQITVAEEQSKPNINFDLRESFGIGTTVTIAEARRDINLDLIPDYSVSGDILAVYGIVTTPNFQAGINQSSYYIQDSTAGINVFSSTQDTIHLAIGDSVGVAGTVMQYHGLTEFRPLVMGAPYFKVFRHNATIPQPKRLAPRQYVENAESYEGQLIKIDSLYKLSGTWPGLGSNANIYLMDASKSDTIKMFIDWDTDIDGSTEPQYPINVVGIAGQYSSGISVVTDGYEIVPRRRSDYDTTITGVREDNADIPKSFKLHNNYPNPFNPSTTIAFELPGQTRVTLKIFNLLGQEVMTAVDEELIAGTHKVLLDASRLSSGLYFYQMKASNFVQTRKMILLK